MTKSQTWTLVGCAVLTSIVLGLGSISVVSHLDAAIDTWGDTGRTAVGTLTVIQEQIGKSLGNLNDTLKAINAPCVGFHGSETCGPLAQLSQTEKNIGILAGKSAQQVQQTAVLIDAAATGVKDVSGSAKATLDEGKKTLEQVNDPDHGVGATMAKFNTGMDDFRTWMTTPKMAKMFNDFADTTSNVQVSTQNFAGVTLDFRKVADKETEDFLKPVKWYMVPVKRGGQFIDIAAAFARHMP